jgi:hypothetical protein
MPQPPSLSPEARQAALQKAAEARKKRAELKNKLKMGHLRIEEVLAKADHDELIGKMKVLTVVESLPGFGKVRARRLLEELGISETRRMKGLGDKQKQRLKEELAK